MTLIRLTNFLDGASVRVNFNHVSAVFPGVSDHMGTPGAELHNAAGLLWMAVRETPEQIDELLAEAS